MTSSSISQKETTRFSECEQIIRNGLNTFIDVGNALTEIRDDKLYRLDYRTFEEYCVDAWGMKRNFANKLIVSSSVVKNLESIGMGTIVPKTESVARELASLEPEQQQEVWKEVTEKHGDSPTAKQVKDVVSPIKTAHVSNNSGNNEWYTPPEFIASARLVMNSIDLDPASSEIANRTVMARYYYSELDNGLEKEWRGNVWLNPPYAQPLISRFSEKLCQSIDDSEIQEAIVLVNNATETTWFQNMLRRATAVCFVDKRIRFLDPDGNPGAPLQGQAILHFLGDPEKFSDNFGAYGVVVQHV